MELVGLVYEKIAKVSEKVTFPLLGEPEQVWEGYTANPLKAYRRSVALLEETSPKSLLGDLEGNLRRISRKKHPALARGAFVYL